MEENIHINAKGNIIDVLKQMKAGFEENQKSSAAFQKNAASSLSNIQNSLKSVNLAAFHQNIQNINQGLQDLNGPGLEFNASLQDLSALTGITGKELDGLGASARASAKEFGGNAAASINTYKMLLGRLGPNIAQSKESLNTMERNVQILSKTMGGDAAGAADALTTGMLQFGVDLKNPKTAAAEMAKMMDVMANSAQAGAAEVPQISAALKVSGVAAKQAKVSFIETNAAIQALAAGGKEGSEAGMALRNVLGKMAGEDVIPKEAAAKLRALGVDMKIVSNTSLPFTTRLRELKKAQGDATIMAQVFGVENAAAANILLDSVDAQDKLATQIGKTGGAQEQANAVMESTAEKMKRMKASIDDAKLSFFEATGGATAYLEPLAQVGQTLSSFTPIVSAVSSSFKYFKGKLIETEEPLQTTNTRLRDANGRFVKLKDTATSTVTPLKNTSSAAKDAAGNVAKMGTSSSTAGSMVKGFGTALAGIGIAAFITLAAEAAYQFYQMASGADEAQRAIDRMKNAKESGDKYGSQLTSKFQTKYEDELRYIERLRKAGKINDEELAKRKLAAAQKRDVDYQAEIGNINALIDIAKTNRDRHLKEGNDKMYRANKANIVDYTAQKNALLADAKEAKNTLLDLQAEQLGRKNGRGNAPIVSAGGYSPKTTSNSEKVMSGAGEVRRIDVHIDTLVKEINVNASTLKEGAAEIKKMVTEALVGSVRDFEVAI